MKKRFKLSGPADNILKYGLIPVMAAFVYALYYAWTSSTGYAPVSSLPIILEHACMSLLIVVGAALITDIHIKNENK